MARAKRAAAAKADTKLKISSPTKKASPKKPTSRTAKKPAPKSPAKPEKTSKVTKVAAPKPKATKKSTRKTAKEATPPVSAAIPLPAPAPKTTVPTAQAPLPVVQNGEVRKTEVVFSFDTTGSMYPCLTQVRRKIQECVGRLFGEIGENNLRIGITAHGDYCDAATYITKHLPLTSNIPTIVNFVENVAPTYGGDAPECYELVLHEAQNFAWMDGWSHILVLIGDEVPHEKNANPHHLDWHEELAKLNGKGIVVHGVQALNRRHASNFYAEVARRTGGCHLQLDQFSSIVDLVMAVCYRESAQTARLQQYEQEIQLQLGRYNRSVRRIFDQMLGRTAGTSDPTGDMNSVSPGRFQVLDVDHDISIKDFVESQGVTFKKGRGFYEFNKPETIQKYKEIIVMDKNTGDMFEGAHARTMLGLPTDADVKIKPADYDYLFFVQSTSVNRKLVGGTKFLYEVDDY